MTVLLYKEHVRGILIFFQQGTAYKHNRFTNHELVQSDLNGKKYERKGTCYFISQHNNNNNNNYVCQMKYCDKNRFC